MSSFSRSCYSKASAFLPRSSSPSSTLPSIGPIQLPLSTSPSSFDLVPPPRMSLWQVNPGSRRCGSPYAPPCPLTQPQLRTKPLGLVKKFHYDERYYTSTHAQPLPLDEDAEYPLEQFQQWIGGPTDIVQRPCRRIVFTITSHDQGWASNARLDRGTYRGSWTWFEAGLERFDSTASRPKDNNDEKDANPAPPGDSASGDQTVSSSPTTAPEAPLPNPYLPVYSLRSIYPTLQDGQDPPVFHHGLLPSPRHTIQFNKTAIRNPTTHKIVWSWNDDVSPPTAEELKTMGRGEETGAGSFVRDLKPGDAVSVWAKSRFGGWANHIDAVRVDVYWAL